MTASADKISWSGRIVSVQPRIRLLRSFDQRQQSYQGYVLGIEGVVAQETGRFMIAIGTSSQEKHAFQVGMEVSGESIPVDDPRLETAAYYKASGLKVVKAEEEEAAKSTEGRKTTCDDAASPDTQRSGNNDESP